MTPPCPWTITKSAVRDYLRILDLPDSTDGADFVRARAELAAICRRAVNVNRAAPRELPSGLQQYRGGNPDRLRLVVSPSQSALVQVLPHSQGYRFHRPDWRGR